MFDYCALTPRQHTPPSAPATLSLNKACPEQVFFTRANWVFARLTRCFSIYRSIWTVLEHNLIRFVWNWRQLHLFVWLTSTVFSKKNNHLQTNLVLQYGEIKATPPAAAPGSVSVVEVVFFWWSLVSFTSIMDSTGCLALLPDSFIIIIIIINNTWSTLCPQPDHHHVQTMSTLLLL